MLSQSSLQEEYKALAGEKKQLTPVKTKPKMDSKTRKARRKSGKADVLSEHQEQVLFLAEFELLWPGVRIFAIPNGARTKNTWQAVKLKTEGLKSGVPDLFVPEWLLWVEMKRTYDGALSKTQKDWIQYLRGIGHHVIVAKGAADGIEQIKAFRSSV